MKDDEKVRVTQIWRGKRTEYGFIAEELVCEIANDIVVSLMDGYASETFYKYKEEVKQS